MTDGPLYDYAEAAHYLKITERQLRGMWERRVIGAVKVGRLVRFAKSDLDAYIAANRTGAVR